MGLFSFLFPTPEPSRFAPFSATETKSPAFGGLADAAYAYAMRPEVEAQSIAGIKQAAVAEGVRVPVQYRVRNRNDSLTKRIRAACMDVCCAKIKRGDVGRSWEGEFVPEASAECKVAVAPILGGVLMYLLGNFIVWLIGKIIWSFIQEALDRLYPGSLNEAPGTVVAGYAQREGIR